MPFKYHVGKTYKTQDNKKVKVLGRTGLVGYECLICDDNHYRYDRSDSNWDAGRCTGTDHDYSCPKNFKLSWKDTVIRLYRNRKLRKLGLL